MIPTEASWYASDRPRAAPVPVLDLLGGQVVRAMRGERRLYRPIETPLCAGSEPLPLARALLQRSGGKRLYVADLDAIQHGRPHVDVIAALLGELAGVELWLDAGFADVPAARALQERIAPLAGAAATDALRPVYGSESVASGAALEEIARDERAILSLDCRAAEPLDPAGCWQQPQRWPAAVIVMTLDRVGANAGPDVGLFASLRAQAPDRMWIGAGGIRDDADLAQAAAAGAQAWLVASALHDGRVGMRALRR